MKKLLLILLLLPFSLQAREVRVIHVYDGNHFKGEYTSIFHRKLTGNIYYDLFEVVFIKIKGVYVPNLKGKCKAERDLAIKAKDFTSDFLIGGPMQPYKQLLITSIRRKRHSRDMTAVITKNKVKLSDALIAAGLGSAKRKRWCP